MVGKLSKAHSVCAVQNQLKLCTIVSASVFVRPLLLICLLHMLRASDTASVSPTSTSAGLARVEVLSDRQTQSLQALERQLTKVQMKTRLMGHDVRPTLRKVSD